MPSHTSDDVSKANAFAQLAGGLSGFWGLSTPQNDRRTARATASINLGHSTGSRAHNSGYGAMPRGDPVPSPLPSPPTPVAREDAEMPHASMLPQAVHVAAQLQKAPPAKQVFAVPNMAPSGFWGVKHPA